MSNPRICPDCKGTGRDDCFGGIVAQHTCGRSYQQWQWEALPRCAIEIVNDTTIVEHRECLCGTGTGKVTVAYESGDVLRVACSLCLGEGSVEATGDGIEAGDDERCNRRGAA
jgi:hypothetical protein